MKDAHIVAVVGAFAVIGISIGAWVVTHGSATNSEMSSSSQPRVTPESIPTTNNIAPTVSANDEAVARQAADEAVRRQQIAEAAQRAEDARLASQRAVEERSRTEAEAKAKLIGSVHGAAWLVRNNGASDVLRGLHIYVVARKVQAPGIKKILQGQIDYETLGAKTDRENAKIFSTIAQTYLDSADKHDRAAAELQARLAQIDDSMETLSAFNLCQQIAPMMDFSNCALSAKLIEGKTDIDGKYTIPNIPGGDYYLYANINTQVLSATWLAPISIKGDEVSLDLDNDSAAHLHSE